MLLLAWLVSLLLWLLEYLKSPFILVGSLRMYDSLNLYDSSTTGLKTENSPSNLYDSDKLKHSLYWMIPLIGSWPCNSLSKYVWWDGSVDNTYKDVKDFLFGALNASLVNLEISLKSYVTIIVNASEVEEFTKVTSKPLKALPYDSTGPTFMTFEMPDGPPASERFLNLLKFIVKELLDYIILNKSWKNLRTEESGESDVVALKAEKKELEASLNKE